MVVNTSSNSDEGTFQDSETFIPRFVRFWLLLIFDIPSIYCSIVLLFHLLVNKTLRSQLTNHVSIVLLAIGLIVELVDIPFHLSFLHLGIVQPSIPFICLLWWFMDFGLYNGCTIIMAWGSIHRYLLIFYDRFFLNAKKRLIFHYLPLLTLCLYFSIFYIIAIIFPPCANTYNYTLPVCNSYPCYFDDPFLGIWDSVMNNILPTIIIRSFSVTILIRVYYQKRRLRQPHRWRKQRKMIIQLLSYSILYLIPNIPLNMLVFVHLCGLSQNIGVDVQLCFDFLCYFVVLIFPFVCLGSLSELRKKIKWKRLLILQRPRQNGVVRPH